MTRIGFVKVDASRIYPIVLENIKQIETVRSQLLEDCVEGVNSYLNNKWLAKLFRRTYSYKSMEEVWKEEDFGIAEGAYIAAVQLEAENAFDRQYQLLVGAQGLKCAEGEVEITLELLDAINSDYTLVKNE